MLYWPNKYAFPSAPSHLWIPFANSSLCRKMYFRQQKIWVMKISYTSELHKICIHLNLRLQLCSCVGSVETVTIWSLICSFSDLATVARTSKKIKLTPPFAMKTLNFLFEENREECRMKVIVRVYAYWCSTSPKVRNKNSIFPIWSFENSLSSSPCLQLCRFSTPNLKEKSTKAKICQEKLGHGTVVGVGDVTELFLPAGVCRKMFNSTPEKTENIV